MKVTRILTEQIDPISGQVTGSSETKWRTQFRPVWDTNKNIFMQFDKEIGEHLKHTKGNYVTTIFCAKGKYVTYGP